MRRTRRNRGSVVLLVVGLLTIIAMLGSTFVFVARMDRRQSKAIAESAHIDGVADDVVRRIAQILLDDLHISNLNQVYGDATKASDLIDAIHPDCDRHLASPETEGGNWPQVSDLGNLTGGGTNKTPARLADTDGDGVGDAVLWDSGISNGAGGSYWVAVRVEDLSGRINANTAYSTKIAAEVDHVLPLFNVSLQKLIGTAATERVHISRCNNRAGVNILDYEDDYNIRPLDAGTNKLPFDMSDMLALAWRRDGSPIIQGRLYRALDNEFNNARRHLTVLSASRIFVPVPVMGDTAQVYKADLNQAEYNELFNAFYNAIPRGASRYTGNAAGEQERRRKVLAAQLAVNVIDFTDEDDEVTYRDKDSSGRSLISPEDGGATTVFGVERQPFVTEAFGKWYREVPAEGEGEPKDRYYYAVELLNPYTSSIDLNDFRIEAGGTDQKLSGTIRSGGRVVIVNDKASIVVASANPTPTVIEIANLSLSAGATITRTVGAHKVIIGRVPAVSLQKPQDNNKTTRNLIWADRLNEARYTRDIDPSDLSNSPAHDYTNKDMGTMTSIKSRLGTTNTDAPGGNQSPCPVYVRNGMMINLGDLCRILYVGPSVTKSLREALGSNSDISAGRMDPAGAAGTYNDVMIPNIPVGALLGNYVMVGSPLADLKGNTRIDNDGDGRANDFNNVGREDLIIGKVNINTATRGTLMSIGGVGQAADGLRAAFATDIITYRNNATIGGFASPAEIARPLHLPQPENNYSAADLAPLNYALSDNNSDDGLSTSGAARVDDDLIKERVYYAWASNSLTVRSDVYIAYIRVQIGNDRRTTLGVRNYVAVIDRSNCRRRTDRPIVHMCARVD